MPDRRRGQSVVYGNGYVASWVDRSSQRAATYNPLPVKNQRARRNVLVIDPGAASNRLTGLLEPRGFGLVEARTASEAVAKFRTTSPVVVILDIGLPDMHDVLRQLRGQGPEIPILILASQPDLRTAVEIIRLGATEFVDRSISAEQLVKTLQAIVPVPPGRHPPADALTTWESDRLEFLSQYEQIFRGSEKMRAIERLVIQLADTNATVLIQGETGAGKEVVARAIHYLSCRATKPWLKINCASLSAELLESELFGHERGAFTGATEQKPGRFELADGGTLLLDEIGEMPLGLQSKLLHVLQDNEFFRVGGRELISVDVRIIAASNKDIQAMVATGALRQDLYYRLNVVNIVVPPLRERREEIPSLVESFRRRFMTQFNRQPSAVSADTLDLLVAYDWPGNVRELENFIKRYVVLGDEDRLQRELQVGRRGSGADASSPSITPPGQPFEGRGLRDVGVRAARNAETAMIREVLERVQWNRAEAARVLKISYKTLLQKLQRGGIAAKPRSPKRPSMPQNE